MSDAYQSDLIQEDTSLYESVAAGTAGIAFTAFMLGLAALFELVSLEQQFVGLTLSNLLGVGTLLVGVSLLGLSVVSRFGYVDTTPDDTGGLPAAVLFGLLWACVAGLVVSQTFGYGVAVWAPAMLVTALGVAALTAVGREDVGSTLPAGAFALFVALVILLDVIGPNWSWSPADFSATFSPKIVVPFVVQLAVLVGAWAAAKAYEGFGSRGRQSGAYLLISLVAFGILSVLVLLVAFVVSKGLPTVLAGIEWGGGGTLDLFGLTLPFVNFRWPFVQNGVQLTNDVNGVYPAIIGTFWLVVGSVLFAVPLGVGAAVFLTEYAEQGPFVDVVEIATNGLWSTPSIVFGLFGFAFLVPRFGNSLSLLSGMLVLGFMLLPLVLITSREAIKSVPDEYRDASAALGVSQWETIRSVVLPASLPGIITGIILGVGRIAGETAPILLVMGGSPFPSRRQAPNVLDISFTASSAFPFVDMQFLNQEALLNPASALPYQLYAIITAGVGQRQEFGWATALVLLLVVLSFYAIGIVSRAYFRRRLHQ